MALLRERRRKIFWIVVGSVLGAIIVFLALVTVIGVVGYTVNYNSLDDVKPVGSRYAPVYENGAYTFRIDADEGFRILQITDVHIGGGAFSIGKDAKALDAVEKLIRAAKPDLVAVTGDIAYPFPIQSGSFNNLRESAMFAKLMEKLEVYYTISFGNHDTESYSFYDRNDLYEFYSEEKYCVIDRAENADGINYAVNIVDDESDRIVQTLYMMDTHAYVKDGNGLFDRYDGLHENQIEWYRGEVARMNALNAAYGVPQSLLFIHIPFVEYETAWQEYRAAGSKDTENVTYYYGEAREPDENVCHSMHDDEMFETILELGSTQGVFAGHDHLNYFSVEYKGVRLTYGMSIDYLAYIGIGKEHTQRGATIIDLDGEGGFILAQLPLTAVE